MTRRRIGILTYHFADNFGAVLQAYGLQQLLNSMGYEAEFIDYRPAHVEKGGSFWFPSSRQKIKANCVVAYQKLTTVIQKVLDDGGRHAAFAAFREQNLPQSSSRYLTLDSLRKATLPYDCLVCGSDQIWNSSIQYGVDPAYFLEFGNPNQRRISFAASFGKGKVNPEHQAEVGRLLKQMDHISIREKSGLEIVQDLAGRTAVWTPDPTLMWDDYGSITADVGQNNYIMSYVLRSAEMVSEVQQLVARELDLPLMVPKVRFGRWKNIGVEINPSPEQWLGYIRDANFVVTNSFHGTAFSVIFRKPFISVGVTGKKSGINDRAKSLLSRLGLSSQFVDRFDAEEIKMKLQTPIDWNDVSDRLKAWRAESREFLSNALS